MDERFLRGRDVGIDNTEVGDHEIAAGVLAVSEESYADVALDVVIGLVQVPLVGERDKFTGVVGTEGDCLGEFVVHGRSACTATTP